MYALVLLLLMLYNMFLMFTGDMAIFTLPELKPSLILEGHADWVFATAFVTPNILISGPVTLQIVQVQLTSTAAGRDSSVKVWNTNVEHNNDNDNNANNANGNNDAASCETRGALVSRTEHQRKVRDIKFNNYSKVPSLTVTTC